MKAEVGKSKANFYLHDHLLLTSPLPNFMTSNFRVLTANIFFYFRLRLGQDIYYQVGEGVHSEREREREREREVGGAGLRGGGGAEADILCARSSTGLLKGVVGNR